MTEKKTTKKKRTKKWQLAVNLDVDKPKNKSNLKIIVTVDGEERLKSITDMKGDKGTGLENMVESLQYLLSLVLQDRHRGNAQYPPDESTLPWMSIEPIPDLARGLYEGIATGYTVEMTHPNKKKPPIIFETNISMTGRSGISIPVVITVKENGGHAFINEPISD